MTRTGIFAIILAGAASPLISTPAKGAVTVNVVEAGTDVVVTSSGSFDASGLAVTAPTSGYVIGGVTHSYRSVYASGAFLGLGEEASLTGFSGLLGPASFGPGGPFDASSSSGLGFAINTGLFGDPIAVYFSVTSVNGILVIATDATATYLGQSFASLGLTTGHYVYTAPNDTVTINVGPVASGVPEPGTWMLMLLGFAGIGLAMRRSKGARRRFSAAPQSSSSVRCL